MVKQLLAVLVLVLVALAVLAPSASAYPIRVGNKTVEVGIIPLNMTGWLEDVVSDGSYLYFATDTYLVKFDPKTNTIVKQTSIKGIASYDATYANGYIYLLSSRFSKLYVYNTELDLVNTTDLATRTYYMVVSIGSKVVLVGDAVVPIIEGTNIVKTIELPEGYTSDDVVTNGTHILITGITSTGKSSKTFIYDMDMNLVGEVDGVAVWAVWSGGFISVTPSSFGYVFSVLDKNFRVLKTYNTTELLGSLYNTVDDVVVLNDVAVILLFYNDLGHDEIMLLDLKTWEYTFFSLDGSGFIDWSYVDDPPPNMKNDPVYFIGYIVNVVGSSQDLPVAIYVRVYPDPQATPATTTITATVTQATTQQQQPSLVGDIIQGVAVLMAMMVVSIIAAIGASIVERLKGVTGLGTP